VKMNIRALSSFILLLITSTAAFGQDVQPFDLAVAGEDVACQLGFPGVPYVQFDGISVEEPSDIVSIAAAGSGRVLGLINPRAEIMEIRPDLTRTQVFSGIDGAEGHRLLVDATGNIYLTTTEGRVVAIRPDGTFRAEFVLPAFEADLAADQCTLFYVRDGRIGRFDVCTGTALPDFGPTGRFGTLRLLPDGGLLVTRQDLEERRDDVIRYDSAGAVTRIYPLPEFAYPLALGRAGQSLLVGGDCTARVHEYDLATGTLLRPVGLEGSVALSIVAYNGFTAALGVTAAAHVAAVPSLSATMLVVLGALLALIAFRRLV